MLGIDNLASLPTWVSPEKVLEQSDLVIVARAMGSVEFAADPSALLSTLKHLHVLARVPVRFGKATEVKVPEKDSAKDGETDSNKGILFGDTLGSVERSSSAEGALFLLPALEGGDEHLSSTALRNGVAAFLSVLSTHGFGGSAAAAQMLRDAADASISKRNILRAASARCELVGDSAAQDALEPSADQRAHIERSGRREKSPPSIGGRALRAWRAVRNGVFMCAQPQRATAVR